MSCLFTPSVIRRQAQVADPAAWSEEYPEFNNQSNVFVVAWCNSSRAADVQAAGGPGLHPTE